MATGVAGVLIVLTDRPRHRGRRHGRLGGVVQAFLPGEEGGPAVEGAPSGRHPAQSTASNRQRCTGRPTSVPSGSGSSGRSAS